MAKIMKLFRNELEAREKINVEKKLEKNLYSGLALHSSGSDGKKIYEDRFKRLLLKSGPGHWTWTLDLDPEKPGPRKTCTLKSLDPEKSGPRKRPWIQRDVDPDDLGSRKMWTLITWTQKNLDPEKPGSRKSWTLKNLDPEKHGMNIGSKNISDFME